VPILSSEQALVGSTLHLLARDRDGRGRTVHWQGSGARLSGALVGRGKAIVYGNAEGCTHSASHCYLLLMTSLTRGNMAEHELPDSV
jgi:hypothetical protein